MKWSTVTGGVVIGSLGLGLGYSLLSGSKRKSLMKRSRHYLVRNKSMLFKAAQKMLH